MYRIVALLFCALVIGRCMLTIWNFKKLNKKFNCIFNIYYIVFCFSLKDVLKVKHI